MKAAKFGELVVYIKQENIVRKSLAKTNTWQLNIKVSGVLNRYCIGDTGQDSKLAHRRICIKVCTAPKFNFFFFSQQEIILNY